LILQTNYPAANISKYHFKGLLALMWCNWSWWNT